MRKRSGAMSAESLQQYITLSEKSKQKMGIFYNQKRQPCQQKYNIEEKAKMQSHGEDLFKKFDFNAQQNQYEKAQKQQIRINTANTKWKTIKFVIICDKISEIMTQFAAFGVEIKTTVNQFLALDLVIRKFDINNQSQASQNAKQMIIMKYWIINKNLMNSAFLEVYVNGANWVYMIADNQMHNKNQQYKDLYKLVDPEKYNVSMDNFLGKIKQCEEQYIRQSTFP